MQQLMHIENIYHLYFSGLQLFFYNAWRINKWTITSKIYFMTFVIHQLNWFKNKITSSQWCFLIEVIQKFVNNFLCIFIRCTFYIVTHWVHYALFLNIFWRNKVNCNCYLNSPCIRNLKINYYIPPVKF